jgi:N6-adenosine-specific RNA methylase IME4
VTLKLPAKYTAARKALAEARNVDEVKGIRDKALAMEIYAKQAKDGELIGFATDIRKRAERRLGEMMVASPKAKAGRKTKSGLRKTQLTLASQGIDKHLADRARKAAAMPAPKFEADVAKARKRAVAAAEGNKAIVKEARAERQLEKKQKRERREKELARRLCALPDQKCGVILEDFEWDFEVQSRDTGMDRHAGNHYETARNAHTPEEVVARTAERFSVAADDCVLFMWVPIPHLFIGLKVMELRGFTYKSGFVWGKDKIGMGYWSRERHEHLLIGVRGKIPAPAPGEQFESLIMAQRGAHSAKPDFAYEIIERYFPHLPKIELNARSAREGWFAWGNEAPLEEAAE